MMSAKFLSRANSRRVLFVIHQDDWDGSQKSLFGLLPDLEKEFMIFVLAPSLENIPSKYVHREYKCIEYKHLYNYYTPHKFANLLSLFPSIWLTYRIIRKFKIDYVYINTISNCYLNLLSTVCPRTVFIQHVRERICGVKKRALELFLNSFANKCLFNTVVEQRRYNKMKIESHQIYNLVQIHSLKSLGRPSPVMKMGYVGQITRGKNLSLVVRALKLLSVPCRLDVYGRVVDRDYFEMILDQAKVDELANIVFHQPDPDIEGILENMHLVISPSFRETFNRVIVEAGCAGKIVIASDIDVHREVFGLGLAGSLISNLSNPEELARTIENIYWDFDVYSGFEPTALASSFSLSQILPKYMEKVFC